MRRVEVHKLGLELRIDRLFAAKLALVQPSLARPRNAPCAKA